MLSKKKPSLSTSAEGAPYTSQPWCQPPSTLYAHEAAMIVPACLETARAQALPTPPAHKLPRRLQLHGVGLHGSGCHDSPVLPNVGKAAGRLGSSTL